MSAIDGFEIIRFVRVTGIASSGDALGFDEFPAAIGQERRNPLRKSEQMGPKLGFASAARRILAWRGRINVAVVALQPRGRAVGESAR